MARRAESSVQPPVDLILVHATTPDEEVVLPANCRGLLVGTGGILNVTINGDAKTSLPFTAGINPGFFQSVQASDGLSGPAANIWAIV